MLQRYNSIYSRHGQIHNCNIKTLVCHSSYGFFWSWFSMKGAIIVKRNIKVPLSQEFGGVSRGVCCGRFRNTTEPRESVAFSNVSNGNTGGSVSNVK